MKFRDRLKQPEVIIFDGAMGAQIQALTLSDEDWGNKIGCSEILNLTLPEKIQTLHEGYLAAGAEVIETNTFGANRIVLAEYDIADKTAEINLQAAKIARRAVTAQNKDGLCFVAGSMGPGTKLASLGQTDFETLYESYYQQATGLLDGGIDLFVIETCQDPLQIRACLLATRDAQKKSNCDLPVIISITVETTGTLLIGTELQAILTILNPFELDAIGINCATGPEPMRPYVKQLCQSFNGPVLCQPNAGIPENIEGKVVYPLKSEEFVRVLTEFVTIEGVNIVGGCCGTTPEFIRALSNRLKGEKVKDRQITENKGTASLYTSYSFAQDPGPFFVGERTNTNGSKKFKEGLLAEDWNALVEIATEQQNSGAHAIDLCVAFAGRDETADMREMVSRLRTAIQLPLFIDSTIPEVIENALKLYGGKAVINSINLEAGEERADRICELAGRYGAGLIALTIDEAGMALEIDKKLEVAKRLYQIAVNKHGIRPYNLIIDPLTFTLGSGDESLFDAGKNAIKAITSIKQELKGVNTILGVSNISFGLAAKSRIILNSVFLAEAVKAGLDMAIVDVKKIVPLFKIPEIDQKICLDLIYNKSVNGSKPLFDFLKHFDTKASIITDDNQEEIKLTLEEKLQKKIIQGNKNNFDKILAEALKKYSALDIINNFLITGMKTVGDLFGQGKMQLPFVLQSAEAMKFAVDYLTPYIEKKQEEKQAKLVLATVRGDVHDIGKNLVDIILTNNGYKVFNLGIKCEIDTILEKAVSHNADAIGMSGLLVKSTVVMKENLEVMQRRNLKIPVLLGGAALTPDFVNNTCNPILDSPVVYCKDAFAGLTAMEQIKNKTLEQQQNLLSAADTKNKIQPTRQSTESEPIIIDHSINIPQPPFWGEKIVKNINLKEIFSYLTEQVIFRGRWGYRRGDMDRQEYEKLIEQEVRPKFNALKQVCIDQKLFEPVVAYGYWPCNAVEEDVIIYDPGTENELIRFHFPRQKQAPFQCIADFFLPAATGNKDLIALQVVTIGKKAMEFANNLYKNSSYKEYFLFHGLSIETAEALAEFWHFIIRKELNIDQEDGNDISDYVIQKYRGSRYSFGYPACPDLEENRKLFNLLKPERIGVTMTEESQMVPEQTTSAFIVHHPQAKYFNV